MIRALQRRTSLACATGLLVALGVTAPATAARSDVEPPQPADDSVTFYAGGTASPDVLANDVDPQGLPLTVCRVDQPTSTDSQGEPVFEDYQLAVSDGKLMVSTQRSTHDFTFTYYACNDTRIAPAQVMVHLVRAQRLTVTALPHHPSKIKVTNHNPVRGAFVFGDFDHDDIRVVSLPADGSKVLRVHHRYVDWEGYVGHEHGAAGYGTVKNVPLFASDARTDKSDPQNSTSVAVIGLPGRNRPAETVARRE